MDSKLSQRLRKIVDALPLQREVKVLEIGCGTGAAAREITARIGTGCVLGIDRLGGTLSWKRKRSIKSKRP